MNVQKKEVKVDTSCWYEISGMLHNPIASLEKHRFVQLGKGLAYCYTARISFDGVLELLILIFWPSKGDLGKACAI